MSLSSTFADAFTRAHARYLASKVVTDLYQCSRLYGRPAASSVPDYEAELVEMLLGGYVSEYEFGFKENDRRVVSWSYQVSASGDLIGGSDSRAGGVYARGSVATASYFNFLTYSTKWIYLPDSVKQAIYRSLPVQRVEGSPPSDGDGYWVSDRSYSNGGVTISRRTFRPR